MVTSSIPRYIYIVQKDKVYVPKNKRHFKKLLNKYKHSDVHAVYDGNLKKTIQIGYIHDEFVFSS